MGKRGIAADSPKDRRLVKGDKPWHAFPKASGLYVITHSGSGRKYVGCAVSLYVRIRAHIWDFRKNRHHNRFMQALWNRDGESAFIFEIHSLHPDLSTLEDAEATLIAEMDTFNRDIGMNLCKRATSAIGRKWNPAQRKKMVKYTQNIVDGWLAERRRGVTLREISERDCVQLSMIAKLTRKSGFEHQQRTKVTSELREQAEYMYLRFAPVKDIARILDIDKATVSKLVADVAIPEFEHIRKAVLTSLVINPKKLAEATLLYIAGKKIGAIAKRLGINHGTLKRHLFQGLTPNNEVVIHG